MASEQTHGKSKVQEAHYELPNAQTMQEAGELMIKDDWGKEVPFQTLYENKPGTQQLVIFIRHFYSNDCEDYIRTISEELPPAFLNASTPPTKMFIIGCGDMGAIPDYRTRTMQSIIGADKSFPIYCDPSRKLYTKLGMMSNLGTGEKAPDYVKKSAVEAMATGVKNAVTGAVNTGVSTVIEGGHPAQNGGELLFANGELVWCKRMRHTQDHAEVAELKEVLGLQ